MKISRYILAFSAVGFLFGSTACSDLSEFEDRLDSLESRVQALENVIPALNQNIEALQALAGGGTINKVEVKDGVYTITLSNGEVLTINQGSIGVANPPVMSLDKDGFWMVDYGTGAEYLLVNGNKVNATGESGITPVFGVDANGYWTVSYDCGKTYEQVLGADEKPVSAVPQEGADEYFSDVVYDGKTFTIELKDGQKITLPVVPTFFFSIEVQGEQVLQAGETKIYPVKSEGVVSAAVVAKPAGVEVSLDDKSLTVRALAATKAVSADSRKDIAVLALSAEGFATIAKMQVSVEGVAVDTTPRAVVAAGEATSYTLAFSVALDNSEAYKYMLLAAGAEAPSAETLLADGTQATATTLVLENLAPATEYALYVLPLGTDKNGAVATAKAATLAEAVPSVKVAAGGATASSLTFAVTLTNGTSYKYLIIENNGYFGLSDVNAHIIMSNGTESTASELVISGLNAETEYILYVLPINGSTVGEFVSVNARTAEPVYANEYEKYMAGKDIVIGNITLNKAVNGEATLVTATTENTSLYNQFNKGGIYFLETAEGGSFHLHSNVAVSKDVYLIGNDASVKTAVDMNGKNVNHTAKTIALKNLDLDTDAYTNYVFANNNATTDADAFVLDNCAVTGLVKPLWYVNVAGYTLKSLTLVNTDITLGAATNVIDLAKTTSLGNENVTIKNCVIYGASNYVSRIVNNSQSLTEWTAEVVFENNTVFNLHAGTNNGLLQMVGAKSVIFKNNLVSFYSLNATEYVIRIWKNTPAYTVENNHFWSRHYKDGVQQLPEDVTLYGTTKITWADANITSGAYPYASTVLGAGATR